MPYHLVQEARYFRVTFTGVMSQVELHQLVTQAETIEAEQPLALPRLIDLRSCTGLRIDFAAMLAITDRRAAAALRNPIKTALIAPDVVHYGFARMFQDLTRHPAITVAIFPTEDTALAWLLAPGLEPPATSWTPS